MKFNALIFVVCLCMFNFCTKDVRACDKSYCSRAEQSLEKEKIEVFEGIDLDDLIAKYEKYQHLMEHLGLIHEKNSSGGFGKFLKYIAFPIGLGGFWVTIEALIKDDAPLNLTKEKGWFFSWAVGTLCLLSCLYAGDYFENRHEKILARRAFEEFLKDWQRDDSSIPQELHPMFKMLQQFCQKDGKINLDDRLLIALVKEIAKKHATTRDLVRKCMTEVNAKIDK